MIYKREPLDECLLYKSPHQLLGPQLKVTFEVTHLQDSWSSTVHTFLRNFSAHQATLPGAQHASMRQCMHIKHTRESAHL